MKCKAVLKEIEEIEADASVSAGADAHLLVCASCRAFAEEHRALRQLVGSLERVSAPSDFDWRLRARLAEAQSREGRTGRWRLGFAQGPQAIALAASFAFLVVAVITYQQMKPSTARLPSTAIAEVDVKANATGKVEETSATVGSSKEVVQTTGSSNSKASSRLGEAAARQRVGNRAGGARSDVSSLAAPGRIFSNDFGARSADELIPAELQNSLTDAGPVIYVPISSPPSARLQFEDGQGTKRTLAPVNFGGQELMGRADKARLVPASETGIW